MDINVIERAFQLAPECGNLDELRRKLIHEGYLNVQSHLSGRLIRNQLNVKFNPDLKRPNGKAAR